jgi:membrane protease YdiL (CAAX protease family)
MSQVRQQIRPTESAHASAVRAVLVEAEPAAVPTLGLPVVVTLHLLPGVLAVLFFALAAPVLAAGGAPAVVAMLFAALLVIVPFELGVVLYESRRRTGTWSVLGAVPYLAPLTRREYLLWVPGVFLSSLLLPGLVVWAAPLLQAGLFSWLPRWFVLYDPAQYSVHPSGVTVVIMAASLGVVGVLGPVVEEIYFRGYLLPRMGGLGALAPFANALLFAVYHLWQPYSVLTVLFAFLPVAYAVWWKRNIYLGIAAHCGVNFITLSTFFVPLLG